MRWMLMLLALLSPVAAGAKDPLADLRAERAAVALALSQPVARCVARHDTGHPAFHGCIDWHSAVHGTWALIAYMRGTGDGRYEALVQETLTLAAVAEERAFLLAHPAFEMPYGRAWFLRLAIDYEKRYGDGRLAPMAREVAASLAAYYADEIDPLSVAYDSASWALINLWDYAVFTGDEALMLEVGRKIESAFGDAKGCPLRVEQGNFMALCTNVAAALGRALPPAAFAAAAAELFRGVPPVEPVAAPRTAHEHGLNFSRAWGFWELYARTGDAAYAEQYLRHFRAGYDDRSNWDGDYDAVGHWVAQFGLYALQPLFGPERGR